PDCQPWRYCVREPKTKNRGRAAGGCLDLAAEGSVRVAMRNIEYQIFHARVREFLSGLTRQDHQNDPFDLFQIELLGIERQQSIDHNFPLTWRENAAGLERGKQPAALGVQAHEFLWGIDAKRAVAVQVRALALLRQISQPASQSGARSTLASPNPALSRSRASVSRSALAGSSSSM